MFLTNTPFYNTVKFPKRKLDTIRQKHCQKYKKRWCTCTCTHEAWHPTFAHQLSTYLIDVAFPDQKKYNDIWISYLLRYKFGQINFFVKKKMVLQIEINIQKSNINQKSSNTKWLMLWIGATFVKKNYYLVARIASFDTAGLHPLNLHILET